MQRTRCPVILVLAALALCSLGVSSQADREEDQYQNQDLDLELRRHRLLQRARSAGLLSQVKPTLRREVWTSQDAWRRSPEAGSVWVPGNSDPIRPS